jgi:hypothetical protein
VHCTNAGFVDPCIYYGPPYFWCGVPKGVYHFEVSSPTSSSNVTATLLSDFGGVSLNVVLP